jgi:hypothetical protein
MDPHKLGEGSPLSYTPLPLREMQQEGRRGEANHTGKCSPYYVKWGKKTPKTQDAELSAGVSVREEHVLCVLKIIRCEASEFSQGSLLSGNFINAFVLLSSFNYPDSSPISAVLQ